MKRSIVLLANIAILSAVLFGLPSGGADAEKTSGLPTQKIEYLGEEITVIRDQFGVPHIFAASDRGAYYGGGYAVAQDRLFQLERYRRDAHGRLAEIEGTRALARDQQVRTLGYTEPQLEAAFRDLRKELRESYEAYAAGINAYVSEAVGKGKVPAAFKEAAIDEPSPWKVTDSIAIGIMMAHRFGSGGGGEVLNTRVLKWLTEKFGDNGRKIFNDLYWLNDPKSPTTIPDDRSPASQTGRNQDRKILIPFAALEDRALIEANEIAQQRAVIDYAEANDLPSVLGSYAWIVSSKRSISGSPILVGGPQMGFSTPQIAHEIHYSSSNLNVIGMGFAGIPGVLIGHNENLAWTTTSGITDMVDIFAEKLNPENKHQYYYQGQYRDMEKRVEIINVKGEKPRTFEIYRTVHGPIVGWDEKAGVAYSRAASFAGRELSNLEAIHGFNRARTADEFGKLAAHIYTNHNFFVATVDGDIGYWHCGKPPVRAKGLDPRLPTPGTGEYDWTGLVPFSSMPQMINPKQGYIVNWNNKPAPWWDNADRPVWGEIFRIHSIERMIKPNSRMSFEQVRDIVQHIGLMDQNADYLKKHLLNAIKRTGSGQQDSRIAQAADYLEGWDNQASDGSVAKTIFDSWLDSAREVIFGEQFKQIDGVAAITGTNNYFNQLFQPSFILHVLDGRESGVPPSWDYFNGKDRDEVLIAALNRALDDLTSKRGNQMNLWGYRQPEINFRPLPGIPRTSRGTYIQVVELSKPLFRSVSILPPGQNEDAGSPHFNDQREMAGYWRFKPMLYKREQLEKP